MVKSKRRWAAPAILTAIVGCNGLAGIREGVFDPCVQDASDPVCLTGGTTASSGSGSATSSGAGGSRAMCGNGVLDPGEECDDPTPGKHGCTQCKVDCSEPKAFKDPATSHCYWVLTDEASFDASVVSCELSGGGRMAAVTSPAELAFLASHVAGPVWIGAKAPAPMAKPVWLDGEPWSFQPWAPGQPTHGAKDFCVVLEGKALGFAMDDCALTRGALCERAPVVGP
jgi:hypothetical protein